MSDETNQVPTRFQEPHVGAAEAIKSEDQRSSTTVAVKADKDGLLVGTNIDEQWRLAKAYHASGMLPKQFNSPEKILIGMQFAYELGLKPLTAMRQIAVINGTPSMYGDLPLAVCRGSGKLEVFREYFIDVKGKRISEANGNVLAEVFGAVCETKRKDFAEPVVTMFTVHDAQKAGLWGKNVWAVYPKRMLQMRARSQNLKDNFSDMINGLAIAEYDFNVTGQEIEAGVVHAPTAGSPKLDNKDVNQRLAELPMPKVEEAEIVTPSSPAELSEKLEPVPEPKPVKSKAKPELTVVDKAVRPYADFVFKMGINEGKAIGAMTDEDLKTYYYQLKAQAKQDGPNESRDDMIEAIGTNLGLKKETK